MYLIIKLLINIQFVKGLLSNVQNPVEGFSDISATDIMNNLLREDNNQTTEVLNIPETIATEGIGGASFDGKNVKIFKQQT